MAETLYVDGDRDATVIDGVTYVDSFFMWGEKYGISAEWPDGLKHGIVVPTDERDKRPSDETIALIMSELDKWHRSRG